MPPLRPFGLVDLFAEGITFLVKTSDFLHNVATSGTHNSIKPKHRSKFRGMLHHNFARRLQETNAVTGFPPHVSEILSPGRGIHLREILCRLVHVCMIETGFVPIIDTDPDLTVEQLTTSTFDDTVPKLIRRLRVLLDKAGNLRNVTYKGLVLQELERVISPGTVLNTGDNVGTSAATNKSHSSPVLLKGPTTPGTTKGGKQVDDDSSSNKPAAKTARSEKVVILEASISDHSPQNTMTQWERVYSGNISVSIIHEGSEIFVVANGPSFHQNMQISFSHYVRRTESFPETWKAEDYLRIAQFDGSKFVDDVKRSLCYPLMDYIDGLSFDVRSLSWFPPEIIVEIAKRCSPLAVLHLRATCSTLNEALCPTNVQFWKKMLMRDFRHYDIGQLASIPNEDKYFKKYIEMFTFMIRRPLRRTVGYARFSPFYLLNNF